MTTSSTANLDLTAVIASGPEMLAAALGYASLGWHVFPLHWPTHFGPQGGEVDRSGCSCRSRQGMCERQAKHGVSRWDGVALRYCRDSSDTEVIAKLTGGINGASTDPELITRWWTRAPASA